MSKPLFVWTVSIKLLMCYANTSIFYLWCVLTLLWITDTDKMYLWCVLTLLWITDTDEI